MRKLYRKLTDDQKARGVIFSSTLSRFKNEQPNDYVHEVKEDTPDKNEVIRRLMDDSFFRNSPFKYNIIRQ